MIGFVEVKVDLIRRAYTYLEKDEEDSSSKINRHPLLASRVEAMSDIINNGRGRRNKYFKKEEKMKLQKILRETAYASFATESDTMLIRIEMASILQDIIKIYETSKE